MKALVAYFSATGHTKKVAQMLAQTLQADIFEILPQQPYTSNDLNWQNPLSRSSVEMANPNSRPEIAHKIENMQAYHVVFLGFPIWWYVAPTIINTFLESYSFENTVIVPFATSGGSGMGKTNAILSSSAPKAKFLSGKVFQPNVTSQELSAWVKSLNL